MRSGDANGDPDEIWSRGRLKSVLLALGTVPESQSSTFLPQFRSITRSLETN